MPGIKGFIKSSLRRIGYRVQHIPAGLRKCPESEISLKLEHLAALQLCRRGDFFFVQVGAFDGSCVDPIHEMVCRYRWRGMLIEPEPTAFASLQRTYKDHSHLTLVQAAISNQNGKATFYRLRKDAPNPPSKAPLVSSLDKAMLLKNVGTQFEPYVESIEVPCRTLTDLLKEHGASHVDLLQIDAEGYDLKILQSLDFKAIRPAVINYEHDLLSPADQLESWNLLLGHDYKIFVLLPDTMACCSTLCG